MVKYYKKVWGAFSSPILDAQNYANYITDTNITDVYKLFDGSTSTYVYLGSSAYYVNFTFPNEIDLTNFVLSAQRYNPVWPTSSVKFYAKADGTWSYLGGFDKGSIAWEGGLNMSYSLDNHVASKELKIELGGGTLVAGDGQTYPAYALELSFTGQQITSIVEITEAEYEANKDNSDYFKVDGVVVKDYLTSQRKYLKKVKVEKDWIQPVLTSNGTLGGNSFAVYCNTTVADYKQNHPAYYAVDGNLNTACVFGVYNYEHIIMYNPVPIKISSVTITKDLAGGAYYRFSASNDNINWTILQNEINSDPKETITWSFLDNKTSYKYFKLEGKNTHGGAIGIYEMKIEGKAKIDEWQECTKEEYGNSLVYYKSIETPFNQPVLTSDGTLGGDSFAVQMLNNPTNPAWQAFNDSADGARISSGASTDSSYTMYNPNPLKISKIVIDATGHNNNEYIQSGNLYGSNNGTNWTLIKSFSGLSYSASTITVNSDTFYKYHKIQPLTFTSTGYWFMKSITITATQQTWQECTKEEYDLLPDSDRMIGSSNRKIENSYMANSRKKYLNKKTVEKAWTQPIMSSNSDNGTLGGSKFACTLEGAVSGYGNPYVLFNGSGSASVTGTTAFYGSASAIITLYNPTPLNITQLTLQQGGSNANGGLHSGTIYGSNDGSNWVHVADYSGLTANAGLITEYINLQDNAEFYKYYQIRNTTGGSNGVVLSEITITATQKVEAWQECTKEEYNDSLGYYKKIEKDWTQPILKSSGTLGGDSFAVQAASNTSGSYHDWQAFDGNINTWWISTSNTAPYIFYNPLPLCIYTINVKGGSYYYKGTYTKVTLAKSDDGNSWVDVKTYTVPDSNTDDILEGVGNSESSKYWRLTFVGDGSYISIKEITLTATELTWQQCTKEEYDLLPDSDRMIGSSNRKIENRYYASARNQAFKEVVVERAWEQPVLTSNGTLGGDSFAVGGVSNRETTSNFYKMFDKKTDDYVQFFDSTDNYITFYNPDRLKISSFTISYYSGTHMGATLYGSNDNKNWTKIVDFNHTSNTQKTTISNPAEYLYHKIANIDGHGNNGSGSLIIADICEITINATTLEKQLVPV